MYWQILAIGTKCLITHSVEDSLLLEPTSETRSAPSGLSSLYVERESQVFLEGNCYGRLGLRFQSHEDQVGKAQVFDLRLITENDQALRMPQEFSLYIQRERISSPVWIWKFVFFISLRDFYFQYFDQESRVTSKDIGQCCEWAKKMAQQLVFHIGPEEFPCYVRCLMASLST